MTDLTQLAADDPGGTLESAYDTLKVMTETVNRDLHRITARDVYTACGSVDGEMVLQALEGAASGNAVVTRVLNWLNPGADQGIDICDSEAQAVMQSLVGVGGVTQAMIDNVIALSTETRLKYPGLRIGELRAARGEV